jgi:hypothetical protein
LQSIKIEKKKSPVVKKKDLAPIIPPMMFLKQKEPEQPVASPAVVDD